jgi:hypothetical protein
MREVQSDLGSALITLRRVVLGRLAASRGWAVPGEFDELVGTLNDSDVVDAIRAYNSGFLGVLRRIHARAIGMMWR